MADDFSWAWGGNQDSSRSSTTRSSGVGRRGRQVDDSNLNEDGTPRNPEDAYGADRPDADRSTGAGRTYYSIGNVNAWNRYQDNLRALQQHQETFGTRTIDRNGNIVFRYDSQQRLNTARNLRASVFDYQNDQVACNGGDQNACDRVGRYGGASSAQYTGQRGVYRPERSVEPTATPAPAPPSDIMGDGSSTTPVVADTTDNRRDTCIEQGNRWTDDAGGACFDYAEPQPPPEQHPDEPPAPDARPEERTGRQEPEPDHSHRVVNPTASGGGSHSGKDGSKTQAGSDGVIHFDSGSNAIQTRPKNEVVEMLNNLRALKNPYGQQVVIGAPYGLGQDVTCRMKYGYNKRLVE